MHPRTKFSQIELFAAKSLCPILAPSAILDLIVSEFFLYFCGLRRHIKFRHNRAMRGRVTHDLDFFLRPMVRRTPNVERLRGRTVSNVGET